MIIRRYVRAPPLRNTYGKANYDVRIGYAVDYLKFYALL